MNAVGEREMGDEVPRGFRFYPTEEELVSFYLHNKLSRSSTPEIDRVIPLLDIYDFHPSDLPRLGGEYSPAEGEQWFFFSRREGCGRGGGRPNRLTRWGYWKATGSPGDVYSSHDRVIGRKRSMVFYVGRAPNGTKTLWKMIEYKALSLSTPQGRALPLPNLQNIKIPWGIRQTAATAAPEITDYSFDTSSSGDDAADLSQFVESGNNRRPEKP